MFHEKMVLGPPERSLNSFHAYAVRLVGERTRDEHGRCVVSRLYHGFQTGQPPAEANRTARSATGQGVLTNGIAGLSSRVRRVHAGGQSLFGSLARQTLCAEARNCV